MAPVDQLVREELLAANLRYGGHAEPLRNRAYAQVVAKVLLAEPPGAYLTNGQIRKKAGQLGDFRKPSEEAITVALDHLSRLRQVEPAPGQSKYRLTAAARKSLEAQVTGRRERIEAAVARHLPSDIPSDSARLWFERAAVGFFSVHGARWVESVARNVIRLPRKGDLRQIADQCAAEVGLGSHAEELLAGFTVFLTSEEPEDQALRWHYGRAMFAAQLLAADLAADPISARELEGSTLLLDTNVLVDLAPDYETLPQIYENLGRALAKRGIKVEYLPVTMDEFFGVISRRESTALKAYDKHNYVVVREANDDFMRLARRRDAKTRAEFEAVFSDLANAPVHLSRELQLGCCSNEQVLEAATSAAKDDKLVAEVQRVWEEQRGTTKSRRRAEHDAALTGAVRGIRQAGGKAWVVTTDLTMRSLAERWSEPKGDPQWITLDALLQVLAVDHEDGNDPGDATLFSPILSRLIAAEVASDNLNYTLEDIDWLDSITQGAEELLPVDVQVAARQVHRRRMLGAKRSDPELRLAVERFVSRKKRDYGSDIEAANESARRARLEANAALQAADNSDARNQDLEQRNRDLARQLVMARLQDPIRRIRNRARLRLAAEGATALLSSMILAGLGFVVVGDMLRNEPDRAEVIITVILVLGWLAVVPRWFFKRITAYRKRLAGVQEEALRQLEDGDNQFATTQ